MFAVVAQATPVVVTNEDLGYYEAAAQVIPTLFLAMVFQGRFFGAMGINWVLRAVGACILLIIANAERTALQVLRNGEASPGDGGTITGALVFMTGILVISAVFDDKLRTLLHGLERERAEAETGEDSPGSARDWG